MIDPYEARIAMLAFGEGVEHRPPYVVMNVVAHNSEPSPGIRGGARARVWSFQSFARALAFDRENPCECPARRALLQGERAERVLIAAHEQREGA